MSSRYKFSCKTTSTIMKFVGILLIYIYSFLIYFIDANHFRGGTISWKSTGNGNEVQFSFKLGWAFGQGPGCNSSLVGQLVTRMNSTHWRCTMGCNPSVNIANVNYICTGASKLENWEQGERTFTHTFPGTGPYKVEFTGGDWVTLDYGTPGSWSIGTVVYLGKRSDTHQPNTSPVTTGKPLYTAQYGCQNDIRIPVVDVDSDDVRCRWSTGSECVSICNALPYAVIDSGTCTISFPSNHTSNGTFAVAVSVEDFPKSTITIGTKTYTPNTPISTVTLQFLIKTPQLSGNCNDKPMFVSPTPSRGSTLQTNILRTLHVSFYATDSRRIIKIDITSPAGMTYTSLQSVPSQPGKVFITTTWVPQQNQVGTHIVCALAEDTLGKPSESRCINIKVHDVSPCVSSPCRNGATCVRQGMGQTFTCSCVSGYTGHLCQTDIDECVSHPCQNNGSCIDLINQFQCQCVPGFTGILCETDINECASNPCLNMGTCNDLVNQFTCSCQAGFTGTLCEIDIYECASSPCSVFFDCEDRVNAYYCKLIIWKVALIVSSIALFNLLVISTVIFLVKRRKYRDVDHTWLSNFINIGKADVQTRVIFKGRLPYQKF